MRELLYEAARHFKRGKALAERGDVRGAMAAFELALRDLHAVRPQRMRDVLLAHVYLSRFQSGRDLDPKRADSDLRLGYSYARTTAEPTVRLLAESLWRQRLVQLKTEQSASERSRQGGQAGKRGAAGKRNQSRQRASGKASGSSSSRSSSKSKPNR